MNCIVSIHKLVHGVDYEILVVDNNSSDNSLEVLDSISTSVNIIKSNVNLGFGKANNLASEHAKGDYLFFLNADTVLLNNSVKIFLEFMLQNINVGVCGGALYSKDLLPTHSYGFFPTLGGELFSSFGLEYLFGSRRKEKIIRQNSKVDYVTGADIFMSKNLFNQVGGFDRDFFMYYEETELIWRIQLLKYDVYMIPSAKIIHYGNMMDVSPSKLKMYFESKLKYFNKVNGRCVRELVKYIWVASFALRFVCFWRNKDWQYFKVVWRS